MVESKAGDLQAFIENHSVFSKIVDLEDGDTNKTDFLRNLVSHNVGADELLVYSPKTSTLFVVALNSFSKTRIEQIQEITLDPVPPTGIKQILCHKNGRLVCLVGSTRCAIIDLGEKRSNFFNGAPIQCRVQNVNSYLHTLKPNVRVLQVEWHPLSDSHFGVLTSDNALRLYEVSSVEDCEQTFHLFSLTSGSHLAIEPPASQQNPYSNTPSYVPNTPYSPSPYGTTPSRSPYPSSSNPYDSSKSPYASTPQRESTPNRNQSSLSFSSSSMHTQVPEAVSFCFGSGTGWTAFSVYFLSQKGHVYCICPVLPHFVRIPKFLFSSLNQAILVKLQVLKEMGTDEVLSHFGYYNAQLKWLTEIQGDTEIENDIANISLSGQLDGFIDTRPPTNKLNLVLQGPMDKEYPQDPPETRTNPCSIVYVPCENNSLNDSSLSPSFGVFVKLFAGGIVEIMLNLEDTNPLWTLKNQPDFETYVPQLLLYEQAKLEVPNEPAPVNRPTPFLLPSTYFPHHFIISDTTGIFSLQLVWLEKFKEFVETQDEITEFPQLPPSQITRFVSTVSIGNRKAPPPLGVTMLNPGFSAGYFAVVFISPSKCTCIDITVEKSTQLATKVLNGVTKPLRKTPVPFQYLASAQSPLNTLETWALLTSVMSHLRKEYVGYVLGCEADADSNFAAINAEIDSQNKRLQYERQKIADQIQHSARIEKRIAGCLKVQDHAAKRIKNIFAIANSSKSLSKAERDYFKELYENYYVVHTKLRSKLEELAFQAERELRKLQIGEKPQVAQLAEDQLNQISSALQDEFQVISQTVKTVKELELAMAQRQDPLV